TGAQTTLADHYTYAVLLHERAGEAFHAVARGRADAHRGVASRMLGAFRHLPDIGSGMDDGMPGEIEACPAAAVEHVDLRRVADPEQRPMQRHGVVDAQLPRVRFRNRWGEIVVRHLVRRRAATS